MKMICSSYFVRLLFLGERWEHVQVYDHLMFIGIECDGQDADQNMVFGSGFENWGNLLGKLRM